MMRTDNPKAAVIEPRRRRGMPDVGPLAVMVSSPADLDPLREKTEASKTSPPLMMSRVYSPDDTPGGFSVSGPVISAPYAAMLMEPLIPCGAKKFIFFGWCGAVSPNVKVGDIIVADGAFIDEGTSLHYGGRTGGGVKASRKMKAEIAAALDADGLPFHTGWIWTTDAAYRETREKIVYFQSRNALAVEMELSALFSVARFRGVDAGAVLVVSDELSDLKWKPGFFQKRFAETRAAVTEVLAKLCRSSI